MIHRVVLWEMIWREQAFKEHIGFYDVQKSQNLQHKKKHPFK